MCAAPEQHLVRLVSRLSDAMDVELPAPKAAPGHVLKCHEVLSVSDDEWDAPYDDRKQHSHTSPSPPRMREQPLRACTLLPNVPSHGWPLFSLSVSSLLAPLPSPPIRSRPIKGRVRKPTTQRTKRRAVPGSTACTTCYARHRRCTGPWPCLYCTQRGYKCVARTENGHHLTWHSRHRYQPTLDGVAESDSDLEREVADTLVQMQAARNLVPVVPTPYHGVKLSRDSSRPLFIRLTPSPFAAAAVSGAPPAQPIYTQ